jgi:hypothetical protein
MRHKLASLMASYGCDKSTGFSWSATWMLLCVALFQ